MITFDNDFLHDLCHGAGCKSIVKKSFPLTGHLNLKSGFLHFKPVFSLTDARCRDPRLEILMVKILTIKKIAPLMHDLRRFQIASNSTITLRGTLSPP